VNVGRSGVQWLRPAVVRSGLTAVRA